MENINRIEHIQQELNQLDEDLASFAKEAHKLDEEIKKSRQQQIENSFENLKNNLGMIDNSDQEEIKKLQQTLEALDTRYKNIITSSLEQQQNLNSTIENMQFGRNELITLQYLENTPLKNTMLSVLGNSKFDTRAEFKDKSPEQRLEIIFRKINTVLTRFYARKLNISPHEQVPEYLEKVVVPATERFLMDILKQSGNETNISFLGNISEISFDNLEGLFQGVNDFSKKFTIPFSQGKALLNFTDFISLPKNSAQLSKLKDPYELYSKVLKDEIWTKNIVSKDSKEKDKENSFIINDITWEQFGISGWNETPTEEEMQKMRKNNKIKIQEEIGTIAMVDTPDTVQKILGILDKTDSFFEQTQQINNNLLNKMDTFGNAAESIKKALGWDIRKEIKKIPLIGGVLNFVLSLLGFSGGIEGLEKAWKKRKIDKELLKPQRDYITEAYKEYMGNKSNEVENLAEEVLQQYHIQNTEYIRENRAKFAIDLPLLKRSIHDKINQNPDLINLATLKNTKDKKFDGGKFVEERKENNQKVLKLKNDLTEEERGVFIEAYIQNMLGYFSQSKHASTLKTINNSDDLAFILFTGITINKDNVIEGIEAEVMFPSQFYESNDKENIETQQNDLDSQGEKQKYNGELMFYDKIPGDQAEFKRKIEEVSQNLNINPNRLMAIIYKETGGTFSASTKNSNGSAVGLIQFMPNTAAGLGTTTEELKNMSNIEQLDYVAKYYQGSAYSGLKDLYLKTFFPAALEHSNNPDYIFASSSQSAQTIAQANPAISKGKAEITMRDFNGYINGIIQENIPDAFKNQFV